MTVFGLRHFPPSAMKPVGSYDPTRLTIIQRIALLKKILNFLIALTQILILEILECLQVCLNQGFFMLLSIISLANIIKFAEIRSFLFTSLCWKHILAFSKMTKKFDTSLFRMKITALTDYFRGFGREILHCCENVGLLLCCSRVLCHYRFATGLPHDMPGLIKKSIVSPGENRIHWVMSYLISMLCRIIIRKGFIS